MHNPEAEVFVLLAFFLRFLVFGLFLEWHPSSDSTELSSFLASPLAPVNSSTRIALPSLFQTLLHLNRSFLIELDLIVLSKCVGRKGIWLSLDDLGVAPPLLVEVVARLALVELSRENLSNSCSLLRIS